MDENCLSRYTIDRVALLYEKFGSRFLANYRKRKLLDCNFTIISNNCWGGHVYRHFGLEYSSPTVGVYFFSEEYMRLLRNLKQNLYLPLSFIEANQSKYYRELKKKNQIDVPIGLLGEDIEVVFLHYKSKEEAQKKWARRLQRVNLNNLIVKNSEMNLCSIDHLIEFDHMKFKKKVLFVSKDYPQLRDYRVVKRYSTDQEVKNDTTYYSSYIDLIELINGL